MRQLFRRLLERHVDDRCPLPLPHPRLEPAGEQGKAIAVGAGRDPVRKVWPPKRGLHMVGLGDAEGSANVGRDRGRRRGRQRQDGLDAKLLGHMRQTQILGPKVVPPLRDAVGLVHRHHRHLGPRQPADELLARQPLRRDIKQLEPAGPDAVIHARRLGRRQRGIEPRRRNAPRLERLDLIPHQGDQRRDHDRQAVQEQAGQLIAERFAGTCRKERECTTACQQRRDHLLLAGAEQGVAERGIENGLEVVGHRGGSIKNEAQRIYSRTVSVKSCGSLASEARLASSMLVARRHLDQSCRSVVHRHIGYAGSNARDVPVFTGFRPRVTSAGQLLGKKLYGCILLEAGFWWPSDACKISHRREGRRRDAVVRCRLGRIASPRECRSSR